MSEVVRSAARTDVGRARQRNEDAFFAEGVLFAVADGLGGHRAGEVASSAALEPLTDLARKAPPAIAKDLAGAIKRGNRAVIERAGDDPELRGMGTTMTVVAVHDGTAHLAHVGDSRCYLIRGSGIIQLTEDHTVVARLVKEGRLTPEQAEHHPQRSMLLRALGAQEPVDVDESKVGLAPGDRLLLCSDGLTAVLRDDEIRQIASDGDDLDAICERLVDTANDRGGPDNITVVLVAVPGDASAGATASRGMPRLKVPHVPMRAVVWSLAVLIVVGGGWLGVRAIVQQTLYVGVVDGRVAVVRGLPGSSVLRGLSQVEERTEIDVEDVAEWYRPRLDEGLRVDTVEEARRIISRIPLSDEPAPSQEPSP